MTALVVVAAFVLLVLLAAWGLGQVATRERACRCQALGAFRKDVILALDCPIHGRRPPTVPGPPTPPPPPRGMVG